MGSELLKRRGGASRFRALGAALVFAFACAPGTLARAADDPAASAWFVTDQGKVRLIAAAPVLDASGIARLGLEFRLAPGWNVYWRSPGDAGLPPEIDWTGSRNLASAAIAWPAPRRFTAYNLETIGYEDAVVLPITARLADRGAPLALNAALKYLTCKDICIPYEAVLTLDLPAGGAGAAAPGGGHAELIAQYAARVPSAATAGGLRLDGARLSTGPAPRLDLDLAAAETLGSPDAFIEGAPGIGFGAPAIERAADGRSATLALPLTGDPAAIAALLGQKLRVTIVDGDRALEATVTPLKGPPPRAPLRLAAVLGLALIGGFILNFMPCVLPVLSLKLLTVTAHAGASRRRIRRGFLASAAGVLAAFLALAAALAGLKAAGLAIGWGIQFQQPAFLTFMTILVGLFAANLAGWFEVPLPGWLGALGAGGASRAGPLGDFAAGVFATLLATPCSAPYLGTAIGFALAGGPLDIFAIFAALGLGLALPYLAVAAVPGIAALLPRPGRWMLVLRRVLAALLALTALWLLWVLAAVASATAALVVAAAVLVAALLLRGVAQPWLRRSGAAAALAAAFLLPAALPTPAAPEAETGGLWRPFDRGAIDRLVAEGKTVFVDVTADWCVNCKVNERLVLGSAPVLRRLSDRAVVAMRADWTRPDARIEAFLRGYGRYGIPFYAVFGPAMPQGEALPEILTAGTVLDALAKAAPAGTASGPARASARASPSGKGG